MVFVKKFEEIRMSDVNFAGGKGASLGEMTNAGMKIPPGFVIGAPAFDHFIKEKELKEPIINELKKVKENLENLELINKTSTKIRELITNEEIPAEITKEIKEKYQELNAEFVAVRSSATAEDGSTNAWAGQLETYLYTTADKLIRNIKECWASLFTPRAITYRFEKGMGDENISVAVVVQKMINSEKSGVSFSVHPVTEDQNQLIIEAGYGLGEAIVSGQITPDNYVVDKKEWKIIDEYISEQHRKLVMKPEGGTRWIDIDGSTKVLTDDEIITLAKRVVKIEEHYKVPVDVEWAIEKREIYILQSRPITTLTK